MENYSLECMRKDEKNPKTLNQSRWFYNKKACVKDFKEVTRNGYNFADTWGTILSVNIVFEFGTM